MFEITTVAHPNDDLNHPLIVVEEKINSKKFFIGSVTEGIQRTVNERKIKLPKTESVFLTGKLSWNRIGGLPGFLLTVFDQKSRDSFFIVYGNPLLKYVIATWRYFIFRVGMNLDVKIVQDQEEELITDSFKANVINISPAKPKATNNVSTSLLDAIISHIFPLNINLNNYSENRKNFDRISQVKLPTVDGLSNSFSTNYLIDFHPVRGKFNVKKAIELGVPKGKTFAQLTKGEDVLLPDGVTVVKSSDVVEESKSFPKLLVLDIPSDEYLEPTLHNPLIVSSSQDIGIVYIFLNEKCNLSRIHPILLNYFNANSHCQFVVSHKDITNNLINFTGASLVSLKLKALFPNFFQLPYSSLSNGTPFNEKFASNVHILNTRSCPVVLKPGSPDAVIVENSLESVNQFWKARFDESLLDTFGISFDSIEPYINDNKLVTSGSLSDSETLKDKVQVVTLGTGSSLPSKYRNVISTVLRVPYTQDGKLQYRSIIMDGGENTIGSIKRIYGPDYPKFFKELQCIYLSHLHADHHLGIISLIEERFKHNNTDLYLIIPWQYETFLKEWSRLPNQDDLPDLSRLKIFSCEQFHTNPHPSLEQVSFEQMINAKQTITPKKIPLQRISTETMFKDLGLTGIQTCSAIHCEWAYSVGFTFDIGGDAFKVSYSGDTRPNHRFAFEIGKNSDLLIHEATLEDELMEDALSKRHSTISEAIYVSMLMTARKLILTHFSQRYPKLPDMDSLKKVWTFIDGNYDENLELFQKSYVFKKFQLDAQQRFNAKQMGILYAFDNMVINYNEIDQQLQQIDAFGRERLELLFSSKEKEL
ncbi:Endonuclease tRNase Z [Komagataella phaffii CBS 7435]|uniref:ribonuclease Z n=2 Tax=Komagataella phaffii TaxID=460519 RepID=C4R647_KOMPG|nr:tRNase Z, involved in RNA processing [Komagataella phaffii GS115]AOA63171.1 GQ67_04100T0 [Komagataella phaffii]CAH2449145.1 Endonuclease tRNase Z [Komagataella phaffii CBS 7435]AOA68869.1 GQ68_04073T0 [Komagataella phaffii GS115]CAY71033.1 tRNase Z, involved in RNA processing [Komagataella phaffii GS115]CCA39172.1 Endonuclease tRNase Z [Komagataella phaffii CBS 7435]